MTKYSGLYLRTLLLSSSYPKTQPLDLLSRATKSHNSPGTDISLLFKNKTSTGNKYSASYSSKGCKPVVRNRCTSYPYPIKIVYSETAMNEWVIRCSHRSNRSDPITLKTCWRGYLDGVNLKPDKFGEVTVVK